MTTIPQDAPASRGGHAQAIGAAAPARLPLAPGRAPPRPDASPPAGSAARCRPARADAAARLRSAGIGLGNPARRAAVPAGRGDAAGRGIRGEAPAGRRPAPAAALPAIPGGCRGIEAAGAA